MLDEDSSGRRPQTRWTPQELRELERLGKEKHLQKLARQQDTAQKITLSWRKIGQRLGGRDAAAAQARYHALLKQRRLESDERGSASPTYRRGTSDAPIEIDEVHPARTPQADPPSTPVMPAASRASTLDTWSTIHMTPSSIDLDCIPCAESLARDRSERVDTAQIDPELRDEPSKPDSPPRPGKIILHLKRGAREASIRGAEKTKQQIAATMELEQQNQEQTKKSPAKNGAAGATNGPSPRSQRLKEREAQSNKQFAAPTAPMIAAVEKETAESLQKTSKPVMGLEEFKAENVRLHEEAKARREADEELEKKLREAEEKLAMKKENRSLRKEALEREEKAKEAAEKLRKLMQELEEDDD